MDVLNFISMINYYTNKMKNILSENNFTLVLRLSNNYFNIDNINFITKLYIRIFFL